jgi:type IV pilus assembly protein PilV
MPWIATEPGIRVHRGQGFALAEVLVAAALLAIGLLGQLSLLVTGMQLERAAANTATAASLAADLGERIRANPRAGVAYALDLGPASAASPGVDCALATPADAPARASCDLDEWQRDVGEALPGAEVEVMATAVVDSTAIHYVITIRWTAQDSRGSECTLQVQA